MAPIKFEEQLKDKLERRTLEPSSEAWDVLSERLDKEDRKNHTTRFWWLGIAASLVGVILVMTQFYKTEPDVQDLPVIVNTKRIPEPETEALDQPADAKGKVVTDKDSNFDILKKKNDTKLIANSRAKSNEAPKTIETKTVVAQTKKAENVMTSVNENNNSKTEVVVRTSSNEDLKIMEVVTTIKNLESVQSSVSDQEIDALLKQAQRELLTQRILDESTKTVSADALLQDVEVELEQSFRAKVFEALKSSYKSVKTAVAQRRD